MSDKDRESRKAGECKPGKVIEVSQFRIDSHAGFPGVEIPELTEEEERKLVEDAMFETWFLDELENPSMSQDEENMLFTEDE